MKPSLGCLGVLAAVFVVTVFYLFLTNDDASELTRRESLRMLRDEISTNSPHGYDKQETRALFNNVIGALEHGKIHSQDVQELDREVARILSDNRLDSLETKALLERLEKLKVAN